MAFVWGPASFLSRLLTSIERIAALQGWACLSSGRVQTSRVCHCLPQVKPRNEPLCLFLQVPDLSWVGGSGGQPAEALGGSSCVPFGLQGQGSSPTLRQPVVRPSVSQVSHSAAAALRATRCGWVGSAASNSSTNSCTKGWGVARCEFGLLRPCSWHAPTAPGVIAPGNIRVHIGPHWAAPSQGLLPLAAV